MHRTVGRFRGAVQRSPPGLPHVVPDRRVVGSGSRRLDAREAGGVRDSGAAQAPSSKRVRPTAAAPRRGVSSGASARPSRPSASVRQRGSGSAAPSRPSARARQGATRSVTPSRPSTGARQRTGRSTTPSTRRSAPSSRQPAARSGTSSRPSASRGSSSARPTPRSASPAPSRRAPQASTRSRGGGGAAAAPRPARPASPRARSAPPSSWRKRLQLTRPDAWVFSLATLAHGGTQGGWRAAHCARFDEAFTQQTESHVCQGSEVSTCSYGSIFSYNRVDAVVENVTHGIEREVPPGAKHAAMRGRAGSRRWCATPITCPAVHSIRLARGLMTAISLTTVGFGEIIDLEGNPAGRIFTALLILVGMGGVTSPQERYHLLC